MIRRAKENDIPAMVKLLYQVQDIHAKARPDILKEGRRKYTDEELREILRNDNRPVFVYEDESGQVQGHAFCIFEETPQGHPAKQPMKQLYLDDLCVDENARGNRIGERLYQHVLAFAKESGCYRVILHVWECNRDARMFYDKMGLVPSSLEMEKIL